MPSLLLLITKDPSHPIAHHALRFAKSALDVIKQTKEDDRVSVFFYADGANTANSFRWQTADQINLTKEWQSLAVDYNIDLQVCVSTALARGVTDEANAARHDLSSMNIADNFRLVGLSELVLKIDTHNLVQF